MTCPHCHKQHQRFKNGRLKKTCGGAMMHTRPVRPVFHVLAKKGGKRTHHMKLRGGNFWDAIKGIASTAGSLAPLLALAL